MPGGISGLWKNTRGAKIARGETTEYKERMKDEYRELAFKYDRLCSMLSKYEAGTVEFAPTTNVDLLYEQKQIMAQYMDVLVRRAKAEDIIL